MRQRLKSIWFLLSIASFLSLRGAKLCGATRQSNQSHLCHSGSCWIASSFLLAMTAIVFCFVSPLTTYAHPTNDGHRYLNRGTEYYYAGQSDSAKVYLEQVFSMDTDEKMTAARYLLDIALAQGDTLGINQYALYLAENYDLTITQERQKSHRRIIIIVVAASLLLLLMTWVILWLRKANRKQRLVHDQERQAYDQERQAYDQQLDAAQSAIERQTFENLQRQAREVLSRGSQRKRILEAFNATYPKAYERLKTTYPDLSEQEYDLLILNFLEFRIKEEAEILELSQNTVMKYRSNLLKKVGKDPVSAVLNAMPTS